MQFNRKYIVISIILAVFIISFFRYQRRASKRNYSDFRVYHATAQRFVNKENIYSRPDESITPFKYSPMFAFAFAPFALFSKSTAALIFFVINFFLVIGIFFLSKRLIVQDKIAFRQNVFLCIASLACTLRFIYQVLDSGQVGFVMLFLVTCGLYFLEKRKNSLSAAFIGLSTMFKYTSFVFLPYFLFRKKYKVVILIAIFIVLYCIIPAIHVGVGGQAQYLKNWLPSISETSLDKSSWYDYKNQSLFSLVLRYLTADSPYKIAIADFSFNQGMALAIALAASIYLLVIISGPKFALKAPVDYSLLFICMALFNPNAWMHNFVILIFVYLTLFYHLIKINFKDKTTLMLIIFSFVLMNLTSESIVGNRLENLFEELSSVTIGSLALLFALFRLKFKKEPKAING